MNTRILTYFLLWVLTALISCKSTPKNTPTYFGGKIINPKSNHVLLYSMEKVIDTLFLDSNNKFLGKFDKVNEGLYYFVHGLESQYIYLEPRDSLMLRLNTWDFDESLVFAGKGAERNNILIDCFLEDEKEQKYFYGYNRLQPKGFKLKIDSIAKQKLATYNNYINKHPKETFGFKNILKVALTYSIYARAESYPLEYAVATKSFEFPKIDGSFYSFRSNVSINKDSLMYYFPYVAYIRSYLYNATYALGYKPMVNEFSSDFTVDLLKTIDNKVTSKNSRNAFLKQTTITHFYRKSSCNVNENAFDTFFELSSNKDDKKQIKRLLSDAKAIQKGQKINDFSIINFNNNKQSIKGILKNKKTLLFFWNPRYVSKAYIASRISYLTSKYPTIQFVQIKINGNSTDRIKSLDIKNQYFIDTISSANAFLTSKMPRTILVNKKGIITNGYASLSSRNIYAQLESLAKN